MTHEYNTCRLNAESRCRRCERWFCLTCKADPQHMIICGDAFMRVEWDSDPTEPPICTDCGLKVYENKFEFGQMHAKKRHCFEEGVGIRKHLDTLVSMHRKAVMLLQGYREGRERDRDGFRKGVAAWQKQISEAEKERDDAQAAFAATGHQLSETEEDRQNANHLWSEEKKKRIEAEMMLQRIKAEISIRVDHGADSNGHLEGLQSLYVTKEETSAPTRSPTGYICPNCYKPSPMMGHSDGRGGWGCKRSSKA